MVNLQGEKCTDVSVADVPMATSKDAHVHCTFLESRASSQGTIYLNVTYSFSGTSNTLKFAN